MDEMGSRKVGVCSHSVEHTPTVHIMYRETWTDSLGFLAVFDRALVARDHWSLLLTARAYRDVPLGSWSSNESMARKTAARNQRLPNSCCWGVANFDKPRPYNRLQLISWLSVHFQSSIPADFIAARELILASGLMLEEDMALLIEDGPYCRTAHGYISR